MARGDVMSRKDREAHERRWKAARQCLNSHDPIGLIALGCPEDEYDPEVPGVLIAIRDAKDLKSLEQRIATAFEVKFDRQTAMQFKGWDALAKALWEISRSPEW